MLFELSKLITQATALRGATGRVGLRVEPDQQLLATVIGELVLDVGLVHY